MATGREGRRESHNRSESPIYDSLSSCCALLRNRSTRQGITNLYTWMTIPRTGPAYLGEEVEIVEMRVGAKKGDVRSRAKAGREVGVAASTKKRKYRQRG